MTTEFQLCCARKWECSVHTFSLTSNQNVIVFKPALKNVYGFRINKACAYSESDSLFKQNPMLLMSVELANFMPASPTYNGIACPLITSDYFPNVHEFNENGSVYNGWKTPRYTSKKKKDLTVIDLFFNGRDFSPADWPSNGVLILEICFFVDNLHCDCK